MCVASRIASNYASRILVNLRLVSENIIRLLLDRRLGFVTVREDIAPLLDPRTSCSVPSNRAPSNRPPQARICEVGGGASLPGPGRRGRWGSRRGDGFSASGSQAGGRQSPPAGEHHHHRSQGRSVRTRRPLRVLGRGGVGGSHGGGTEDWGAAGAGIGNVGARQGLRAGPGPHRRGPPGNVVPSADPPSLLSAPTKDCCKTFLESVCMTVSGACKEQNFLFSRIVWE